MGFSVELLKFSGLDEKKKDKKNVSVEPKQRFHKKNLIHNSFFCSTGHHRSLIPYLVLVILILIGAREGERVCSLCKE